MTGEYTGTQTLYPPDGKEVSYDAFCTVNREACERFIKIDFFAEVPDFGPETWTSLLTYSPTKECYQKWLFSSSAEEPLHLSGNFVGDQLVMVSEPWAMPWGLQRLRGTFISQAEGAYEYLAELWTPDGYVPFRRTIFIRQPLHFER